MKLTFLLLTFVMVWLSAVLDGVSCRPSVHMSTRVCDAREFLKLYQRTCTFYGKRSKKSNLTFRYGVLRIQRDVSNQLEFDPAPELARKCCLEGCSVHLIGLHCNTI